jgi:hypothetical protein
MAGLDAWPGILAPMAGILGAGGFALANHWARRRIDIALELRELELKRILDRDLPVSTTHKHDGLPTGPEAGPTPLDLANAVEDVHSRVDRLERVDRSLGVRSTALLELYHRQGLSQSRVSFWFSLLLGAAGLGVIVYALLTENHSWATALGGAVTEAVSALIFTQSSQARRVMSEFFDRARDDRRLEEALGLADRLGDPPLRDALHAVLALELVNAKTTPSVLPGFQPTPQTGILATTKDNSDQYASALHATLLARARPHQRQMTKAPGQCGGPLKSKASL